MNWNIVCKNNKNSTIYIDTTKKYFKKEICLGNLDLQTIHLSPEQIFEIEQYPVWKELHVLLELKDFFKNHPKLNYVKMYEYQIEENEKTTQPQLSIVFENYESNIIEYIKKKKSISLQHVMIQLFFQFYYLDLLHIHHEDIHLNNVILKNKTVSEPLVVFFENEYYEFPMQKYHFHLIDFGFVQKRNFSNFREFCKLIKQIENETGTKILQQNYNTYNQMFQSLKRFLKKIDKFKKIK